MSYLRSENHYQRQDIFTRPRMRTQGWVGRLPRRHTPIFWSINQPFLSLFHLNRLLVGDGLYLSESGRPPWTVPQLYLLEAELGYFKPYEWDIHYLVKSKNYKECQSMHMNPIQ
jgi:hypothetical protein